MTNFVLDHIDLKNVRRYGNDGISMDFPLNNLTVFTGKVGAGKSTILKAVSMALYGEDGGAKNQKLSIDDLVNEKNKKNLEIHLYFHSYYSDDIGDSSTAITNYEIHLFHKHSKYNNKLVFVKDGKDISLASKTETYALIEKTLIPSSVYHNTYYFTQNCKNFFTSLSNSEQKEIFNSILDLSEYEVYYENTKKKIEENKDKYTKLNSEYLVQQERVNNLKNNIDFKKIEHDKKIEEQQSRISELELMVDDLKTETDKLAEQVEKYKSVNDDLTALEMQNQERRLNMESETTKLKEEYKKLMDDFDSNEMHNTKQKYINLRGERSRDLQSKIQNINAEIEKLKVEEEKMLAEVDSKSSDKMFELMSEKNNAISNKKDEIKKYQLEVAELGSECHRKELELQDEIGKKISNIEKDINSEKEAVIQIDAALNLLRNEYTEKVTKLKNYKEALDKPDAVCSECGQKLVNKDHIRKHIEELEKKIEEIKSQGVSSKEERNKHQKIIDEYNSNIQDLNETCKSMVQKLVQKKDEDSKEFKSKLDVLYKEVDKINEEYDLKYAELKSNQLEQKNAIVELYAKNKETKQNELSSLKEEQLKIDNQIKIEYREELDKLKVDLNKKIEDIKIKISTIEEGYNTYKETVYINKYHELRALKEERDHFEIEQSKTISCINEYNHEIQVINNNIKKENDNYVILMNNAENTLILENDKFKKMDLDIKQYKKTIEILEFWKTAFSDSGIKSMLIDSALPHMNECVSAELEKTAPGKFTVSFDTLSETKTGKIKDKFNINILNNETHSTGHKKLSGGEMRIVDLCCMSALRALSERLYGKRFFHIFYDEILDSLDGECKQMFCANVKMQSTTGRNIVLITHDLPDDVDPDRVFPF